MNMTTTQQVPTIGSTFGDDSPRARRTDPETSQEAADTSVTPADSQALVLRVLARTGPLADPEGVSPLSPQIVDSIDGTSLWVISDKYGEYVAVDYWLDAVLARENALPEGGTDGI